MHNISLLVNDLFCFFKRVSSWYIAWYSVHFHRLKLYRGTIFWGYGKYVSNRALFTRLIMSQCLLSGGINHLPYLLSISISMAVIYDFSTNWMKAQAQANVFSMSIKKEKSYLHNVYLVNKHCLLFRQKFFIKFKLWKKNSTLYPTIKISSDKKIKYNFLEIIYHVHGYGKWLAEINGLSPLIILIRISTLSRAPGIASGLYLCKPNEIRRSGCCIQVSFKT